MKKCGHKKYIQDIKELDNLYLRQYKDVNIMFKVFQNNLIEIIDNSAPCITLFEKQSKLRPKPWITSSIFKFKENKNLYYHKFIKTKNRFWFN